MISDTEQLVVFVSSSQQEGQFWKNLLPELQNNPEISGIYSFQHLPIYSMLPIRNDRSFLHRLLQRHQRQTETLARVLQKSPFWSDHPDHDPELTLVGLRHGGRVIQEFLLGCLNKDEDTRQIRRVRQAVFLAPLRSHWIAWVFGILFTVTPLSVLPYLLWPSQALLVGIASALAGLFAIATGGLAIATSPPALIMLGMESEWFLGARIRKEFEERIKHGNRRKLGTWPVPSQELWKARVKRKDPKALQEIAEAILKPIGHPNIYEIDLFESTLTIKPVQLKDLPQGERNNLVLKEKYTSQATLIRHVRFAGNNQTANEEIRKTHGELLPWELRHRTRGYLEVQDPPPQNLATSDENFTKNRVYIYRFHPKSHENYFLHVTIYGGHDTNNRDAHIHIRADASFRLIRENLDLSGYLSQGWSISEPKALFFHSPIPSMRFSHQPGSLERGLKDLECDCLSSKRGLGLELQVQQISPGVFRWEKSNVRNGGIIAFEFDVSLPSR